jgi:hypothetical protein
MREIKPMEVANHLNEPIFVQLPEGKELQEIIPKEIKSGWIVGRNEKYKSVVEISLGFSGKIFLKQ